MIIQSCWGSRMRCVGMSRQILASSRWWTWPWWVCVGQFERHEGGTKPLGWQLGEDGQCAMCSGCRRVVAGLRPIEELTSVTQLAVSVVPSVLSAASALASCTTSAARRFARVLGMLSGNVPDWMSFHSSSICRSLVSHCATVFCVGTAVDVSLTSEVCMAVT